MYCGVRFGLSLGDECLELFELVELVDIEEFGLVITLDHGLFDVVGVALRLVVEDTDDSVGEDGRPGYHVGSPCRSTIEAVCWRLNLCWGYFDAGDSGTRQGELELCCISAELKSRSIS
jgi:hypothetical protein